MSLPSGYTQLEYIESSGGKYINTGFLANQNTRVVIDCQRTGETTTYPFPFGERPGLTGGGIDVAIGATQVFYHYGDNYQFADFAAAGNRMTIDANKTVATFTSGSSMVTITLAAATFQESYNITLFALLQSGAVVTDENSFTGRIYSCKIYDNGTLVRDFVPCKNASGTVGLWDDVGSQFYQNAGTGTFTAGPQVLGSHKTMVGGTIYDVTGGKCMVGGTVYDIQKGLTMVGGTVYEIQFSRGGDGLTWYLNETVDVSTDMSIDIGFCVVSTGERFTGISIISILGRSLMYKIESNSSWTPVFSAAAWVEEKYRTITFDEAPTGTLLEWLQENGKAI